MCGSAWVRVAGCLGLLGCLGLHTAQGQPPSGTAPGQPTKADSAPKLKRVVYDVKHAPAKDLAELLTKLYKSDPAVQALSAPAGNALVLSAPAGTMDEVVELLRRLDRRPRTVVVEVLVAEVTPRKGEEGKRAPPAKELNERELMGSAEDVVGKLHNLQQKGLIGGLKRFRLTAAENQAGSLQVGENRPTTTGTTGGGFGGKGGGPRSVAYRNVGTIVRATPRLGEANTIFLDVRFDEARLSSPEEGVVLGADPNGQPIRAADIIASTFEGKVAVTSGDAVALSGVSTQSKSGRHQTLVIVTARFQEPDAKAGK
jgi:general secretion pathway protein D